MKNLIVVGLVMLGLGFAIGWKAKPEPVRLSAAGTSQESSKRKGIARNEAKPAADAELPPTKRAERPPAEKKKTPGMPTDEQMAQAKKMQSEMSKAMIKRMRGKFDQQIEKLAESLNLTAEQKAALIASLDERMAKVEGIDFTNPETMKGMEEAFKGLTNKSLEDDLASSLTPDQQEALKGFKEKELRGKVDTMALKSLSKMQGVIEFEDGQRDEIYKILTEEAEAAARKEEESPDVAKMMTEGMGIDMDPYDLGLQQVMTDAAGMDGSKLNSASPDGKRDMAQTMRAAIDERINAKVEILRPVLNEKQLEKYRNELQTKGLGMYGPILNSMQGPGAQ